MFFFLSSLNQHCFSVVNFIYYFHWVIRCSVPVKIAWELERWSMARTEQSVETPYEQRYFLRQSWMVRFYFYCVVVISIFLFCFYLSVSFVSDYCAIWSSCCPSLSRARTFLDGLIGPLCVLRLSEWKRNQNTSRQQQKNQCTHKASHMNELNSTRINYLSRVEKKRIITIITLFPVCVAGWLFFSSFVVSIHFMASNHKYLNLLCVAGELAFFFAHLVDWSANFNG